MKKMRLSMLIAMLAVVTVASAQFGLGIKGGVNMSNFYGSESGNTNMKIGFHVGLAADYNFAPDMAIQSGLYFTSKGAKVDNSLSFPGLGSIEASATMDAMYLQLPIHFAYKLDVTPGTRIVFHAGPYLAYGVAGKTKVNLVGQSTSIDTFGKDAYERFDAGLGLGVGAEFGSFLVDLGWDMGMVKLAKNTDSKNQNAYLSVGYRF